MIPFSNRVILNLPIRGLVAFAGVGEHRVDVCLRLCLEIDRFPGLRISGQCGWIIFAELENGTHPATRDVIDCVLECGWRLSARPGDEERSKGKCERPTETMSFEHEHASFHCSAP